MATGRTHSFTLVLAPVLRVVARSALALVALVALIALTLASRAVRAQDPAAEKAQKAQKAEAVKADLSRLGELEKAYFEKNKTYTVDTRALNFAPTSGAQVSLSYASARSWAANATHPVIAPFVCFLIVSSPAANTPAEKPFCTDSRRGTAAAAIAQAGPASSAAPPVNGAGAKVASASPKQDVPQKKVVTPPKQAAQAPATVAPEKPGAAQKQAAPRKYATRRGKAPVPALKLPAMPAQGDVAATARAQTRAASPVSGSAGAVEAVTVSQFTERLSQIATGAMDAINQKTPEVERDPYESTAEYEARRAAALAVFARRENEYWTRSSRTLVVQLSAKEAKYDADREILWFSIDPVPLPTSRSFAQGAGTTQLAVTCYTRSVFWCSPSDGMTYEAGDLWRVLRARARELDVLRAPLIVQARFAVTRRDEVSGPSLTLVGLELQAKGQTVARWDAATATAR